MGCITAIFGVILPRFALLVAWTNAQEYWNTLFSSQLWLGLGFLFLPWTTLIYGFSRRTAPERPEHHLHRARRPADLGTWGVGSGRTQADVGLELPLGGWAAGTVAARVNRADRASSRGDRRRTSLSRRSPTAVETSIDSRTKFDAGVVKSRSDLVQYCHRWRVIT
jgi:hypothetical protein